MSSFTGWRVLVNFLLPPPMLLTFLLVLPFPRNVRKGILMFTSQVLNFSVLGGMRFVHLALVLSGVPLVDSGFRTFKSAQEALDHELTPNQRISVLAKKWREERNFWIAAMAFTLWCLLTVLYAQVGHALRVEDRLDHVQSELNELKGIKAPAPAAMPKMPGFGFGRKTAKRGEEEEHNATAAAETELTPAGADGPARRRPGAAVGASQE